MAKYVDFNPILAPAGQLGQLPVNEGNFIITDDRKIYVDTDKERMSVSGEKGEPGPNQVSPGTSVKDIPDDKILTSKDGKVAGMDIPEGLEPVIVQATAPRGTSFREILHPRGSPDSPRRRSRTVRLRLKERRRLPPTPSCSGRRTAQRTTES